MLECDKCGGKIVEESKFCPHCGDPVTAADKPITSLTQSTVADVEIRFGYSRSANYDSAVSICQNLPSYETDGEEKGIQHTVKIPISEVELVINIWELVGSWKSSKMLINGQHATKSSLVYKGVGCFRERLKAYDKGEYCFGQAEWEYNIWGCKKLGMSMNAWGGGWLDYGAFDSSGAWRFDKNKIRHELEMAIHEYDLCPVLDRNRIMNTVDKLPDTIHPKRDANWEFRTDYQEVKGEYRQVAVGIKPVLKKANAYIIGEYKPHWKTSDDPIESSRPEAKKLEIELTRPTSHRTKPTASNRPSKSGCFGFVIIAISGLIILSILSINAISTLLSST